MTDANLEDDGPPEIILAAPMLVVPDVNAAADWYIKRLGFEVEVIMHDPSLPAYAIVCRDGYAVHFLQGQVDAPPGSKGGINLEVSDVNTLFAELSDRCALAEDFPRSFDATREHPPEDKSYGRRDFILVDPFGYVLVFGEAL